MIFAIHINMPTLYSGIVHNIFVNVDFVLSFDWCGSSKGVTSQCSGLSAAGMWLWCWNIQTFWKILNRHDRDFSKFFRVCVQATGMLHKFIYSWILSVIVTLISNVRTYLLVLWIRGTCLVLKGNLVRGTKQFVFTIRM